MELKDIKAIIDLMKRNDLSFFEMERQGFKIRLKRNTGAPGGFAVSTGAAAAFGETPATAVPLLAAQAGHVAGGAPKLPDTSLADITSPMVGTYYHAMSPESPPYVKLGDIVNAESVVCIIEAMKVMNEIKAETAGTITEILVENGKPVQFGQALFRVRPA